MIVKKLYEIVKLNVSYLYEFMSQDLIISQTNRKKGRALALRIQELKRKGSKITEPWIAKQLNKTRGSVANWKSGKSWPSLTEEQKLEDVLGLSSGFFAKIGEGEEYTTALKVIDTQSDKSRTLRQVEVLMDADPQQPAGPFTMEEIQQIIRDHMEMFFRLAIPEGNVTLESMRKVVELAKGASLESLRKSLKKGGEQTDPKG